MRTQMLFASGTFSDSAVSITKNFAPRPGEFNRKTFEKGGIHRYCLMSDIFLSADTSKYQFSRYYVQLV